MSKNPSADAHLPLKSILEISRTRCVWSLREGSFISYTHSDPRYILFKDNTGASAISSYFTVPRQLRQFSTIAAKSQVRPWARVSNI